MFFIYYECLIILLFFILFIFIPSYYRIRTCFFSFLFSILGSINFILSLFYIISSINLFSLLIILPFLIISLIISNSLLLLSIYFLYQLYQFYFLYQLYFYTVIISFLIHIILLHSFGSKNPFINNNSLIISFYPFIFKDLYSSFIIISSIISIFLY